MRRIGVDLVGQLLPRLVEGRGMRLLDSTEAGARDALAVGYGFVPLASDVFLMGGGCETCRG